MEEQNLTASAIISFSEQLEDRSAAFYEQLAARFAEDTATFLGFAEGSQKNKVWVTRTYQETISDALEACFCFEGLPLSDYEIEPSLAKDAGYVDALTTALELEERAIQFYRDVAQRSESLLATIPGAFRRVAKKRSARKLKLESLQKAAGSGS
jgi:rubrerythrin